MWTIWSLIWALDTVVKMGVFLDSIICSAGILNATTTLGSGIQKICSAISTHDDCIVAGKVFEMRTNVVHGTACSA